ncbi:hypothetical protein [Parafrankia elaeagni]|uniref:hypothetical protein n=1 Tax=Parafrankia elaeagni TaxID=222534 RepID=UPI00037DE2D8|nr:hypothetical protein [Parafrankia elaeagni]
MTALWDPVDGGGVRFVGYSGRTPRVYGGATYASMAADLDAAGNPKTVVLDWNGNNPRHLVGNLLVAAYHDELVQDIDWYLAHGVEHVVLAAAVPSALRSTGAGGSAPNRTVPTARETGIGGMPSEGSVSGRRRHYPRERCMISAGAVHAELGCRRSARVAKDVHVDGRDPRPVTLISPALTAGVGGAGRF